VNSAPTHYHPQGVTIHVAGVDLLPSAVARLALLLHQNGDEALSDYLGRAVDKLRDEIPLREKDYLTLLAVLREGCPTSLEPLRAKLESAVKLRRA
jgi:hypothetical protein